MIDPHHITNFKRTDEELEEFLLFCICVANKPARITATKLAAFLEHCNPGKSPIAKLRVLNHSPAALRDLLIKHRLSPYEQVHRAFEWVAWILEPKLKLDLRTCTAEDLEQCPKIGMKTARFFLLHSRPDANVAVIDTHMLKFLRKHRVRNVPRAFPVGRRDYLRLERKVLEFAKQQGMTPAEFDLWVWNQYAWRPKSERESKPEPCTACAVAVAEGAD
jgi:thermostable 8-oxoguanine DNA glycosylase